MLGENGSYRRRECGNVTDRKRGRDHPGLSRPALVGFYRAVTGWETVFDTYEFVYLAGVGSFQLGFQRVDSQQAPAWPSRVAQAHLGLSVPDLDTAEAQLLALGAVRADPQPNEQIMRVLLDPAGHPFYVYVRS
jgi:catechol 2,3-dioxygenase-like lactoylglutathione lyase family enzyme